MSKVDYNVVESDTLKNVAGEGFNNLLRGYASYANESIVNRAIPNIYDGMKPVQRFALQIMDKRKPGLHKSQAIAASTIELHPHGDTSVYQAIVRTTDRNGLSNVPYFLAHGEFGHSYSTDGPAAPRYTEVGRIQYHDEFFTMTDAVNELKTEDGKYSYLEYLPVSFPNVLANEANGMGVGIATKIPSFNVVELTHLVDEYITTGKMSTILAPDFSSGGYIINDQKEFAKLMTTGQARVKLRAKLHVEGDTIIVDELPFGVTVEALARRLASIDLNYISSFDNFTDLERGFRFVIKVSDKKYVEQVLLELYKYTDLQKSYSANMIFVKNYKPIQAGVYGVIDEWMTWRKGVILNHITNATRSIKNRMKYVKAFMELLNNEDLRDKVIEAATRQSAKNARALLVSEMDIEEEVAKWILDRKVSQFKNGGKYATEFANLNMELKQLEEDYQNPEGVILRDMERIRSTDILNANRRTEITNEDYNFIAKTEEEAKLDESECTYTIKDGFIKKLTVGPARPAEDEIVINATASDVILAIDEEGRLYRIYGEDLEYNSYTEHGTYIPRYANQQDETNIMWAGLARTDKQYLTIYSDGYASILDTTPFARENVNQRSRLMLNGVNPSIYDKGLDIVEINNEDDYLVIEDASTRNLKLGLVRIKDIEKKARTARTKIMNAKETSRFGVFTTEELEAQELDIATFENSKEKRKMEVYNGAFPEHIEEYDDEEEVPMGIKDARYVLEQLYNN